MSLLESMRLRIIELEEILGLDIRLPNELGLTPIQTKMLGLLIKKDVVSLDAFYAALYGDLRDCDKPEPKIVEVHLSAIRKKLKKINSGVNNRWGIGWYLNNHDRDKLRMLTGAEARSITARDKWQQRATVIAS